MGVAGQPPPTNCSTLFLSSIFAIFSLDISMFLCLLQNHPHTPTYTHSLHNQPKPWKPKSPRKILKNTFLLAIKKTQTQEWIKHFSIIKSHHPTGYNNNWPFGHGYSSMNILQNNSHTHNWTKVNAEFTINRALPIGLRTPKIKYPRSQLSPKEPRKLNTHLQSNWESKLWKMISPAGKGF